MEFESFFFFVTKINIILKFILMTWRKLRTQYFLKVWINPSRLSIDLEWPLGLWRFGLILLSNIVHSFQWWIATSIIRLLLFDDIIIWNVLELYLFGFASLVGFNTAVVNGTLDTSSLHMVWILAWELSLVLVVLGFVQLSCQLGNLIFPRVIFFKDITNYRHQNQNDHKWSIGLDIIYLRYIFWRQKIGCVGIEVAGERIVVNWIWILWGATIAIDDFWVDDDRFFVWNWMWSSWTELEIFFVWF